MNLSAISRESALRTAAREWKLLIGGQWVSAQASGMIDVRDPSTGQIIASAPAGTRADVDAAVAAARDAFDRELWLGLGARERRNRMLRVADLIVRDTDRLEEIEILNNGMPRHIAQRMSQYAVEAFRYFSGWCQGITGKTMDLSGPLGDFDAHTRKEPMGVAALIVPWNGPLSSAAMKMATALAAGCTCVLKPSEETPVSALMLGEIMMEAGIPAGVINIVTGYGHEAGAALAEHKDVDKVSFTGSTEVGKKIIHASTGNLKKVSLELGGKSPVIVFDDANLDQAIPGAARGVFHNSGQICMAGTRLFVQRNIFDRLIEGVTGFGAGLRLGGGFEGEVDMGPLISETQLARVSGMIATGRSDGAEVLGGGRVGRDGYFIEPTVIVNPPLESVVVRDEIFGPVVSAIPFDEPEEAIALANDTSYGLASAVWTGSLARAKMVERRIATGTVWINCQLVLDLAMPFGGYKQSGWGREFGSEGVDSFLQTKSVITAL